MKRALLVGPMIGRSATERQQAQRLVREVDLVIAVDGGVDRCHSLGLRADLAIGDWDGVRSRRHPSRIPSISLPRRKDRSDFYWAVELAHAFGAKELRAIGFDGGRRDHEFAVWLDAAAAAQKHADLNSLEILSRAYRVAFVSGRQRSGLRLAVPRGATFSVFSLRGIARGVSLRGGKYTLQKASLDASSLGLSNRALRSRISVSLKSGALAIVVLGV